MLKVQVETRLIKSMDESYHILRLYQASRQRDIRLEGTRNLRGLIRSCTEIAVRLPSSLRQTTHTKWDTIWTPFRRWLMNAKEEEKNG